MIVLFGALGFGSFVYLSTIWCARVAKLGPRAGTIAANALRAALCCGAAIAGGIVFAHAASPATIFAVAMLCGSLGATCFLATLGCPVPAVISGATLAILAGAALMQGNSGPLASACATGAPFAATAFLARGSGADWRDAVVAALGGAAFGLPLGIIAVTFACVALAFVRPYLARHRTAPRPPARFSSAMAGTFLLLLVGQLAIS